VARLLTGAVVLAALVTLSACEPGTDPSAPPSSPGVTATAAPLVTGPGQARDVLDALVAAAGSAHAIKAEFGTDWATLTVVIGDTAATWAYRNGAVAAAETDTAYVGQAIFDPRDYAPANLAALFQTAAQQSGSDKDQRLQIAEYSDGRVFLSVVTNPESSPVFFRADGSLIAPLDFTTAAGLAEGLADVTAGLREVLAVGLDGASGALYSLHRDAAGTVTRTVRLPGVPVHDAVGSADAGLAAFDPARIDAAALAELIARLPALTGAEPGQFSFAIDRRGGAWTPSVYLTAGGQTIKATLAGAVVPA
jgi:hypothetical protein